MNIRRIMLCVNCDDAFERCIDGRCPSCGSIAVYPLARWTEAVEISRISEKQPLPHIRRQLMETGAYAVK